jgi:hypothetical protein
LGGFEIETPEQFFGDFGGRRFQQRLNAVELFRCFVEPQASEPQTAVVGIQRQPIFSESNTEEEEKRNQHQKKETKKRKMFCRL